MSTQQSSPIPFDPTCAKMRRAGLARYAWHVLKAQNKHEYKQLDAAINALSKEMGGDVAESELRLLKRYAWLCKRVKMRDGMTSPEKAQHKNKLLRFAYADCIEERLNV